MTTIRAFFCTNQGNFFQFLKKGKGDLSPSPPSSYAPDTALKFINISIYNIFGYTFFKQETIGKLGLAFKSNFQLTIIQNTLCLNAYFSLVLVCKVITEYGRTTSKRFSSTVGTFSLTRWILSRNILKHLSIKFLG